MHSTSVAAGTAVLLIALASPAGAAPARARTPATNPESLAASLSYFVGEWRDTKLGNDDAGAATLSVQADGTFVVWKHATGTKRCRIQGRLVEGSGRVTWLGDGASTDAWKRARDKSAAPDVRAAAKRERETFCDPVGQADRLSLATTGQGLGARQVQALAGYEFAPWGQSATPYLAFVDPDQFAGMFGPGPDYFVFRRVGRPPARRRTPPRWVVSLDAAGTSVFGALTLDARGRYQLRWQDDCAEEGRLSPPPPRGQSTKALTLTGTKATCGGPAPTRVLELKFGSPRWHPLRPEVGWQLFSIKGGSAVIGFYPAP